MNNPNCDGNGPHALNQEVRLLPLSDEPHHGNLILCRECFSDEIRFRMARNSVVATPFDLPAWDSLKVYGGAP